MSDSARIPFLRWGFISLLSLLAAVLAIKWLFVVSPSLNLSITFSREEALQSAKEFREQYFPDLETSRQAIVFDRDQHLQNYVELEGGGVDVYQTLIETPEVATHWWRVRLFHENQEEDLSVYFNPAGALTGFYFHLPESAPGAELDQQAAYALAVSAVTPLLHESLDHYQRRDASSTRQSSGRVDHRFTWELQTVTAGEARFRLEALVAGDRLILLYRVNHIPEAFTQRFGEMRATNTLISQVASGFMALLLGLGGFVCGGIWLMRRRQLQWKKAFLPGIVVASGVALMVLVNLPIAWMDYQTTASAGTFLVTYGAAVVGAFFGFGIFWISLCVVAEGLSRVAFPQHPRLYDFFRAPQAASPEIAGRILGGYWFAGFFLLYAVLFIALTAGWLGWWQPAYANVDPNILASWRPGIAPLFTALQAGTWEEFLFRVIPLSLAVIIGRHVGHKKTFVVVALFLQALIFAGAHADYPNLPGYSRLIELFIPAMVFGLVFLRFGLMVAILAHFLYDLVLMSMPLFMVEDSSLWIDRCLVIAAGLAPLAAVLWARFRVGQWIRLPASARNDAVVEQPPGEIVPELEPQPLTPWNFSRGLLVLLAAIGLAFSVSAWVKPALVEWPAFSVSPAEALRQARDVLDAHDIVLDGEWHATVVVDGYGITDNRFVWQESGAVVFQNLIGRYLPSPGWRITWKRFDGPVEERAEVWVVRLSSDGSLTGISHAIPESRAGASLDQEQALQKASEHVRAAGWGDTAEWQQKSVEAINRPERLDWQIVWLDSASYAEAGATAQVSVTLGGDEVLGSARSIDIPDAWSREQSSAQSARTPYSIASVVFVLAIYVMAIIPFFWKRQRLVFSFGSALPWMLVTGIGVTISGGLWLVPALDNFDPLMGWYSQIGMMLFFGFTALSVMVGIVFLLAQVVNAHYPVAASRYRRDMLTGAVLGLFLTGIHSGVLAWLPALFPPSFYHGDYPVPLSWLVSSMGTWKSVLGVLFQLALGIGLARFISARRGLLLVIGATIGWLVLSVLASQAKATTLLGNSINIITVALTVALVLRGQTGVAMAMLFTPVIITTIGLVRAAYPLAGVDAAIAIVVGLAGFWYLTRCWYRRQRPVELRVSSQA